MKEKVLALIAITLFVLLLTAGCTQTPQSTGISPVATSSAAPVQTSANSKLPSGSNIALTTPGPTQTLPVEYSLTFQVQSNGNTANPKINVNLRGGNGLALDSRVDATILRTDGIVENGSMLQPLYGGQQITFNATDSNKNRVEIWVTAPTVGKVKVFDDYVPIQSINS